MVLKPGSMFCTDDGAFGNHNMMHQLKEGVQLETNNNYQLKVYHFFEYNRKIYKVEHLVAHREYKCRC